MSPTSIEYFESRHLLRILDQLNDIEIIWLRFYREPTIGGDEDFRETHRELLRPAVAALGSSQDVVDKQALQESYTKHLSQLGLLAPVYERDIRTEQPEFDSWSGEQRVQYYEITNLGRLLLREIGLGADE